MNDVIELFESADDFEIAIGGHAQAHINVTHNESRRQAVAGTVGDCDSQNIVGDRDEVIEISADDLRRHRATPDLESAVLRNALRQNRLLDALRLDDERFVTF